MITAMFCFLLLASATTKDYLSKAKIAKNTLLSIQTNYIFSNCKVCMCNCMCNFERPLKILHISEVTDADDATEGDRIVVLLQSIYHYRSCGETRPIVCLMRCNGGGRYLGAGDECEEYH